MIGDFIKGQKVEATFIGRFRGGGHPKQRYGVQSGFRFQLEIMKIEETKRITSRDASRRRWRHAL
jgi:hypothetical protein